MGEKVRLFVVQMLMGRWPFQDRLQLFAEFNATVLITKQSEEAVESLPRIGLEQYFFMVEQCLKYWAPASF
ncbi:hypothetical protein D9M68_788360 [compost metagenome]